MKKILVAGGAGFLGSHLIDRLLAQGHQVICLDNLLTGSLQNIEHLSSHPHFTFIRHDVCDPIDLKVDEIYNLACPASPPRYQADPIHTMKTSFLGALNLLELARKNNAKIFQASTSEVYGDPHVHPQMEDYWGHVNPIGLRSCYDEGKRCAETLFFDYSRKYQTKIRVARIFNTYGPRMDLQDGRVVSNFLVSALQNEPITIYGDGSQTRSFCYVDDLIEVILRLMASDEIGPINIGNPTEFSVAELAKQVIQLTSSQSTLAYHPLPSDDPKQRRPSIEKAKTLLGWEPKIALREGLSRTSAYFQKKINDRSKESAFS